MSIAIMTQVWSLELPHTEKLVLLALADNANDEGECWPSMTTLERKCGLTDRSLRSIMSRLEERGLVGRQFRDGRSTLYTVTPEIASGGRTFPPPRNVVPPTPEAASPTPRNVVPPEPSLEPSKNRQVTVRAHASLPQDAWDEWLAHRRSRRWPCDTVTLGKQLKLLAGFDADTQRQMIDTSIQAGWQGLFEPKGRKPRPTRYDELMAQVKRPTEPPAPNPLLIGGKL